MGALCPRRADGSDGGNSFGGIAAGNSGVGVSGDLAAAADSLAAVRTASPSNSSVHDTGADSICNREDPLQFRPADGRSADAHENFNLDSNGRVILMEKPGSRCSARDAQGGSHRARKWRGTTGYIGSGGPIDTVRQAQRAWLEEHPEQLLKWSFPTKQRDCLKVSFRAAQRTESLTNTEFKAAFGELVQGHSRTVVRTLVYLYLNYLHPHHKRIQAQGRHILMLKVYEGKSEAHCWFIPLKEVLELHTSSTEAMSGGVSLNDVQLVQTYVIENTFVLHIETFERDPRRQGNLYGKCTWVGGMVLHLITEDNSGSTMDRTREMAMMPDEGMAELTEARCKVREKRARQKEKHKQKREEELAAQEAEAQRAREAEVAAAAAKRKEELVQPHESLCRLFKNGTKNGPVAADDVEDDSEEDGLTQEELAMFTNSPSRREGLIQPHASLTTLLKDSAKSRG